MEILVVDDDQEVRMSLRRSLEFEGYQVRTCRDGEQALAQLTQRPPDLMLLDLQMPGIDGVATCRKVRAAGSEVPIIMLTARDQLADRVLGLDVGADDYLAKPFALEELLARIRAQLRRRETPAGGQVLRYAQMQMDLKTREVARNGCMLELTPTEWSLLEVFLKTPKVVHTREILWSNVWGYDFDPGSNTLDVYIGYLRKKMEEHGPRILHTIRGVGYCLRDVRE